MNYNKTAMEDILSHRRLGNSGGTSLKSWEFRGNSGDTSLNS